MFAGLRGLMWIATLFQAVTYAGKTAENMTDDEGADVTPTPPRPIFDLGFADMLKNPMILGLIAIYLMNRK